MTERQKNPSNRDIQAALDDLAQAYHQFAQALLTREDAERDERRYLRERLDTIAGVLDRLQAQIDRRLDQVWQEVDHLARRVTELEQSRKAVGDASDDA